MNGSDPIHSLGVSIKDIFAAARSFSEHLHHTRTAQSRLGQLARNASLKYTFNKARPRLFAALGFH